MEDWDASVGFDFYDLHQQAERSILRRSNNMLLFHDIVWPNAEIRDQGFFGQLVYRNNRLEVGTGFRVDSVQAEADNVSDFFLDNTEGGPDQNETNLRLESGAKLQCERKTECTDQPVHFSSAESQYWQLS